MFSLLLALTMYLALAPVRPSLSVTDYLPHEHPSLPMAADADKPVVMAPEKKDPARLGIETTARAAIAVDAKTGVALYEKNADEPLAIASITKLMSALVVLERRPDWEQVVEVKATDERSGGFAYLAPGEKVTVRDLFNMSLVASANGATVTLARSTGLTEEEFVARMNALAKERGMSSATFVDPTGLDEKNQASARDVAALLRAALSRPEIGDAVKRSEYRFTAETGRLHAVRSTDELLGSFLDKDPYKFLGGKTGYIAEAGYCFGAGAQNKEGNGVYAVALGTPSKEQRFREVKALLYWAFDAYEWPQTGDQSDASAKN